MPTVRQNLVKPIEKPEYELNSLYCIYERVEWAKIIDGISEIDKLNDWQFYVNQMNNCP